MGDSERDHAAPQSTEQAPHDLTSEAALLGAAMTDQDAATICASLPTDAWYFPAHQTMATAVSELVSTGAPVEVTTVHAVLTRDDLMDTIGGMPGLLNVVRTCAAPETARFHARTLTELHALRKVMVNASQAAVAARDLQFGQAMDLCEAALDAAHRPEERSSRVGDLLGDHLDLIERRAAGEVVTIPTGLTDLDNQLDGIRPGQLVVVCARPGIGKTALAGQLALNVARSGRATTFVSLEMGHDELLDRMLAALSGVPHEAIRKGKLNDLQAKRVWETAGRLAQWPLTIEAPGEITVPEVRARARTHKAEVVIVDYLGLVKPVGDHGNRQEEVASMARSFKALARILEVPVICLAQLNRQVEMRADKRPLLADLRESGEIEQSADVVLGLYRDEYYDPQTPEPGVMEILIRKNRHGPQGAVQAAFLGATQSVTNLFLPGGVTAA